MEQRSKWVIFSLVAVIQFMVVLDSSIVNVALPAIKEALSFEQSSLQWIITSYVLGFGGFLMLGGRAADLFGRKKILLAGLLSFTLFSLLIGLSQSALMMIIFRALQGLAAAFMSPAALSTVLTIFKEGPERHRALGLWTTVSTGGAAAGLLFGGLLTFYLDWRWNFFVNVPIGLIVGWYIYKIMPAHIKEAEDRNLDLPGAILVTTGLIALVYGFGEVPNYGWLNLNTLGAIFLGVLLLVAFIWNESKAKHPLMPLSIFKIRNVVGANLMMIPITASMMGQFFLISLYVSGVLGYSSIQTGLAFLPFPIILGFAANRVSRHVHRFGYKPFLITGIAIVALCMAWLSRLPVDGNYAPDLLPVILAMPLGLSMIFMPLMVAATSGVPGNEAGLVSGMVSTSQQMGGAFGLAILSGIAASATLGAGTLPAAEALLLGYNRAFLTATIFLVFAIIIALTVLKQPKTASPSSPPRPPVVTLE